MKLVQFASITKKMALAAVAAFLVVFLPVHMGINLCLLRSDGGVWYSAACHFMGTNYIVKVFEVVLFGSILLHIFIALLLAVENKLSRPIGYAVRPKSKTSFMSRYMVWTGMIIFCFLVLHMINFYFVKLGFVNGTYIVETEKVEQFFQKKGLALQRGELSQEESEKIITTFQRFQTIPLEHINTHTGNIDNLSKEQVVEYFGEDFKDYEPDFYAMCRDLFGNPYYSLIYMLIFVVLGFHLYHGLQSLFQTFGLHHDKYNNAIRYIALAYAIILPIGFGSIPIYFLFCF